MKIIDAHAHMNDGMLRMKRINPGLSREAYIKSMDDNHVERCWVSNVSALYGTGEFAACNKSLRDFCKGYEKRLTGFFTVNPIYGINVLDEIKRCVEEYGFKGLKLHPWCQGFSVTFGIMNDIVEECIKYCIPIIFHDGTPPYSSTLPIANIAERYPESIIILGHSGLTEMYGNAIDAANKFKNLYLCTTGPSISQLQKIVDNVDTDRIMFGSDVGFDMNFMSLVYRLDMWNYVNISNEIKEKIFYRNAEALIPA